MGKENYKDKVMVDPESCGGRPHIKGTRIEISVILDNLAEGRTPDEIVDHYPLWTKSKFVPQNQLANHASSIQI